MRIKTAELASPRARCPARHRPARAPDPPLVVSAPSARSRRPFVLMRVSLRGPEYSLTGQHAAQMLPTRDSELGEHFVQVVLDGTRADEQTRTDFTVR